MKGKRDPKTGGVVFEASESEIQSSILQYLGHTRGFFWRNNTGAMKITGTTKDRYLRWGAKGSPDILGVLDGRFIAIEVKKPGGVVSPAQKEFIFELERHGAKVLIAYCLQDVIDFILSLTI